MLRYVWAVIYIWVAFLCWVGVRLCWGAILTSAVLPAATIRPMMLWNGNQLENSNNESMKSSWKNGIKSMIDLQPFVKFNLLSIVCILIFVFLFHIFELQIVFNWNQLVSQSVREWINRFLWIDFFAVVLLSYLLVIHYFGQGVLYSVVPLCVCPFVCLSASFPVFWYGSYSRRKGTGDVLRCHWERWIEFVPFKSVQYGNRRRGELSRHRHSWIAFSAEAAAAWEYHNLTLFLRIRRIKKSCSAPIHNDDYIVEWKQLPEPDLNWYVVIYVTKCLVTSLRTNSSFSKRTIKSILMFFFLHAFSLLIQFFQKLFIN